MNAPRAMVREVRERLKADARPLLADVRSCKGWPVCQEFEEWAEAVLPSWSREASRPDPPSEVVEFVEALVGRVEDFMSRAESEWEEITYEAQAALENTWESEAEGADDYPQELDFPIEPLPESMWVDLAEAENLRSLLRFEGVWPVTIGEVTGWSEAKVRRLEGS